MPRKGAIPIPVRERLPSGRCRIFNVALRSSGTGLQMSYITPSQILGFFKEHYHQPATSFEALEDFFGKGNIAIVTKNATVRRLKAAEVSSSLKTKARIKEDDREVLLVRLRAICKVAKRLRLPDALRKALRALEAAKPPPSSSSNTQSGGSDDETLSARMQRQRRPAR